LFFGFGQDNGSPYLSVNTADAVIPLKASKTEVQISGTIAHVRVTQVYQNLGKHPIEAKYVFPLSTQAAVHKMQMTIGDRIVNAKIFERQEAEKVYDTALKQGKRAAKLDQDRPNVFQMNVGNIIPNDEIAIDIYYTEMLVPVNGEYQFVAPAVVGPRFTGESANSEASFNMPYTAKGTIDTFDFDMTVTLNAGMIIQNIGSSSHKINVNYPDVKTAEVFLSKSNENPSNRDFILNYNLRGKKIQSGLLLYEHENENFFAYQMEPTKNIALEDIPAREYLFIVDVSGSMNGYPLDVSKELMRNLLCDLRATDTFNVQLFASSSTVFSTLPVEVNEQNIEAAIRFLSEGQGGGGTQLLSALNEAYKLPRKDGSSARSMVVITDGYVSVEKEAFELIRSNLDQANVFTFGIGSSVNRYLIEGMAKVSKSESFIATTMSEAKEVAKKFKDYIATPLLAQVKIEAKGFDIYDVAPSSIPDVFAARPVLVYGKYHSKAKGMLIVTGYQGKNKFRQEFKVSHGHLSKANKALRYLWARKKIEELDDYKKLFNEEVKDRVIALGLKYNLVTSYTSFVAVDEAVVNKDGTPKTVKQPLPMPQNVANSAVGAAAEVNEKTVFKKTFQIAFDENILKTEKRQLTMEFKAIFSKLVKTYLDTHKNLRIKFNAKGQVVGVEKMENGQWVYDTSITKEFIDFSTKRIRITKKMVLTLTK
jgi:Ca-activated chloride channel family protein